MKTFIFIIGILSLSFAKAGTDSSSRAIELNKQGNELIKKQNFVAAQEKFAEGLAESPFASELQVNLGLAFDGAGNKEKAQRAYELATKNTKDPEVRFVANFNLAELAGRDKKLDEALAYYQEALKDQPDSVEVKTNIELLIQNQQQQNGKGESKEDKDNKDKKNDKNKDQKQDQKSDKDKDKDKKDGYDQSKPQPKPFKSDQLSPGDVKKILEELDRQEQRVRAEYNKKQVKERPRDKDW